ncbi:hypothetical protein NSA27_06150 [Clostridium tepidum]|uniref:hypothetical protein n=1 Tax=Clostridium tepidum TaxID=1962263 RepID=UPI00214A43D5|nr:hypothetical protein [Clostridium tepidum]MCR1934275.1 hypothetical protein [Clostridium tepidum]
MAIDKIRIYLDNVSLFKERLFQESYKENWLFERNKDNNFLSYFYKDINDLFIKYMPIHKDDALYIDFNPAFLLRNDNTTSIYSCNIQQIYNIIREKLKGTLDISVVPNLRYWKVSYYENNINIIRYMDEIKALYKVISKLENIGKLKKEIIEDGGTIYFFNGKSRAESDFIIKIYFKLRQISNKNPERQIDDYYDSDLVCLKAGQDILRIEVSLKRDRIYKLFKPIVTKFTSDGKATEIEIEPSSRPVAILEEVFDFNSQVNIMNKVLKLLHLDKTMTTKIKLFSVINGSSLSKNEKHTAKVVLNYLNKVPHIKVPAESTISKYKRWILSKGYHYIYADVEIKPISIDDIIKQLPKKQQDCIKVYRNSNIYYDLWSSYMPTRIY